MERMTEQEILDVVQAYMDGKELEFQANSGSWYPASEPNWNFSRDRYRVKRQPRVIWVNGYFNMEGAICHLNKENCVHPVKFIEVLDD